MKNVKFTVWLPAPLIGVMEYEDEELEDAVSSGEIYYHGLDFLSVDEYLKLTFEVLDADGGSDAE